ncbi:MAG: hypothetical protein IJH25_13065 [Clostridia bacterium]|nr:hypothetical protein [Clostridia bacterium]
MTGNPEYKDRLFSFMFGNSEHREWTLSLYNAVNGTRYDDPEQISIETIRQVLYMGMHDDVAFIIADILSLYEQQSTFNPNMPVRMLEYTANLMEKYMRQNRLNKYSRRQIMLPVPKLVVFYNGLEDEPDEKTLWLSDALNPEHRQAADITVKVRMININQGRNAALMNMCRPLTEYAWIVDRIRQENKTNTLDAAIDKTINRLPGDFVTKPFLEAHRAEVKNMLLTEYNEAETMELFKEEGRAEGRAEGTDSASLRSIRNLMRTMKLTAQEAMNALGIPEGDRNRYAEML